MGKGNWVAMSAAAAAAVVILAVAGRVEGRRGYGEEVKAVHIAGEVLCQDCNQGWAEWIDGKPIKGTYVRFFASKIRHNQFGNLDMHVCIYATRREGGGDLHGLPRAGGLPRQRLYRREGGVRAGGGPAAGVREGDRGGGLHGAAGLLVRVHLQRHDGLRRRPFRRAPAPPLRPPQRPRQVHCWALLLHLSGLRLHRRLQSSWRRRR